jgi:hypothetical protein
MSDIKQNLSLTLVNNPCHGFLVIAGVVDTGNKFLTGVNDTGQQLLPVTATPAINLSQVTTTPMNSYRR